MAESHKVLKDTHKGEDIWVIAAGASMDYVYSSFFEGKTVIGCNRVDKKFPCTYTIHKELATLKSSVIPHIKEFKKDSKLILAECRFADYKGVKNDLTYADYVYTHLPKPTQEPMVDRIGSSDDIVVSHSIITTAIHMASYMGAKNIIICGHDCGSINGNVHFAKYYTKNFRPILTSDTAYKKWVTGNIEQHTIDVANKLREVYDVNIHSLNPFINFGLEGNEYSR